MNDLIRKNDALDILCKFCGITEDVEKCRKTSADGWCKEYCELKNMPTVDAVPVVHGKWMPHIEKSREYIGTVLINVEYDYWLCKICGYRVENGQPMYNFCPNCGARMDEEKR